MTKVMRLSLLFPRKLMENFYLAYVVNGLIGLFVGYVWGVFDGYRTGLHRAQKAAQSDSKAKTDNHPQEP